jgi:histidinol dehydrogenase
MMVRVLDFPKDRIQVERILCRASEPDLETERTVRDIIGRVRRDGDKAVAAFMKRFDGVAKPDAKRFRVSPARLKAAWDSLDPALQKALKTAHDRIRAYHQKQMLKGFVFRDALGNRMEQRVAPLRRVGVYVPGGTAAYPSTVLMDVVPARVAGVPEIVMITPPLRPGLASLRASLGAAYLAGVTEVVGIGGAHGVAAMALGTETLRRVDKIVGPGNKYVAMAKRLLYGEIDIDMIAGPSEVLILADRTAPPHLVAADMLSQAEHDLDAQATVILIGQYDLAALQEALERQTAAAHRREFVEQSLRANGAIIRVRSVNAAVELANAKAPEHLEILTKGARALAKRLHNVGAIFVGPHTPEPMGDYVVGPNHTLPTGGTARFYSPLSVLSFLKTSHVVECSRRGFDALADAVVTIAEAEGLGAHAEAVVKRQKNS